MASDDEWRQRHTACVFGAFRPARAEGWLEATCANPRVSDRYSRRFCACECQAFEARPASRGASCDLRSRSSAPSDPPVPKE